MRTFYGAYYRVLYFLKLVYQALKDHYFVVSVVVLSGKPYLKA